jgi:putative transposase
MVSKAFRNGVDGKRRVQGVVVGWSMSHKQDKQMVLQAVLMALWQRQNNETVTLHSDRGTQFTSDEYQRFLRERSLGIGFE